jgi:ABC-type dipeptide/oligopeptide/nickel transport system ATPase component
MSAVAGGGAESPRTNADFFGLRKLVGVVFVSFLGLFAAHFFLGKAAVVRNMVTAFEAGGAQVGWFWAPSLMWDVEFGSKDARATVQRPALVADLAMLLRPGTTDHYALIVGDSGSGKSTAVREAVRSLQQPKGAIYFSAPVYFESFSSDLARAVGYALPFDPLASVFSRLGGQAPSAHEAWPALLHALREAATRYHLKHSRPAVLVIDAADFVAKKDPNFFLDLQNFAKVCADMGMLRVVFVSSEGIVLPLLRASSSWSRALLPYEVQDIDDAQAADYLINRGMARPVAEEAVRTITGGRFALLLHVASAAAMKPIADMRKELDVATDSTLKRLGILPTHALFRALIAAGRVPSNSALDLLPEATLDALLGKNIIALHPDGAYTVHARHVESFLRKHLSNHTSLGTSAAPMTPTKATALREVKRATSPEGKDEGGRAEEL